jgi:hypothetical protein
MKRVSGIVGIVAVLGLAFAPVASAENTAEAVPTFTKDVAPILFNNCVICHRPGEVAPMSLLSYQEARPWSRAIKEKVVTREMPPWHADRRYGEFRNARGLTQEQIDTIVAWVDAGAPKGEDTDMPPAPVFAEGWSHPSGADPDDILSMPVEYTIPAEGEIPNFSLYTKIPYAEDRFLEAVQLRPSNRAVTHHSGAHVRELPVGTVLGRGPAYEGGPVVEDGAVVVTADLSEEQRRLLSLDAEELENVELSEEARRAREADAVFAVDGTDKMVSYVPGRGFEQFWPGAGKRVRAGRYMSWGLHYQSTGKLERDRQELGLWFQKVQATHEVLTQRVGQTHLVEGAELIAAAGTGGGDNGTRAVIPVIPPNNGDWAITGITAFKDDVTLYAMSPHMHLRGKDLTYVVTYPDGAEEILLSVPKFDFNWQLHYELKEPKKIPAGSTIKSVGHFDNSVKNRYNPAPHKEVYWAEQSWDEMYNGFMEYSIDKLDLSKEKPATE